MRTRLPLALILAVPLVLFAACGQNESPAPASQGSVAEAPKEAPAPATGSAAAGDKGAPAPASKVSVAEGVKVFADNCEVCHYADKTDAKLGPGLKGLFKNRQLPFSHKPATEENIREQILNGNPQGKPMPMPGFAGTLSAEQVDSLILFLKTL